MAALPSHSLLMVTHDSYWCDLGSTSTNSPCRTSEYPGEATPHHPGKSTLSLKAIVLESPECSKCPQASSGMITCDMALEAMRKEPGE
ncbi:unnamed protein product [Nyctereutes procyonoides]|uniref:(raccoon dog) hypothetical protein n=1 Tax=Nyctereutes procyonoides TaxID=34880 RepID=A0A811YN36_NYCPR|nr:unnamed protein product [Nyctereutes procyonoides]